MPKHIKRVMTFEVVRRVETTNEDGTVSVAEVVESTDSIEQEVVIPDLATEAELVKQVEEHYPDKIVRPVRMQDFTTKI